MSEEDDNEFERKREKQRIIVVIIMGIFGFLAGYSLLYEEKAVKIILMLLGL